MDLSFSPLWFLFHLHTQLSTHPDLLVFLLPFSWLRTCLEAHETTCVSVLTVVIMHLPRTFWESCFNPEFCLWRSLLQGQLQITRWAKFLVGRNFNVFPITIGSRLFLLIIQCAVELRVRITHRKSVCLGKGMGNLGYYSHAKAWALFLLLPNIQQG